MSFARSYLWMLYQAQGAFTFFLAPTLISLGLASLSIVCPRRRALQNSIVLLQCWLVLVLPAFAILAVGTIWMNWKLFLVGSFLGNILTGAFALAQIALAIWMVYRRRQFRFQVLAASILSCWCSYAAAFVAGMAINDSWL